MNRLSAVLALPLVLLTACRRAPTAADAGPSEVGVPTGVAQVVGERAPAPGSTPENLPESERARTTTVAITQGFDPYKKVPNYHELNRSRAPPAITIRDGRILFMNHCAGCHGGDGRGLTGKGQPRMPDFSAGAVQDELQDAAIMRAVISGHAGSPSYARLLDDGQVQAIVQFMRELRL